MQAVLVQEKWVEWPDSVNDRVGNILLSRIMGAEVRLDEAGFDIGFRDSWRQAIDDVTARGGTPYAIPAGASDHRLGGLGFAHWAHEVAQQEAELGVFFDTIVVCTVTGLHARRDDRRLRRPGARRRPAAPGAGIDASATLEKTRDQVARIARGTAELIGVGAPARRRDHRAGGLGRRPLRHPGRVDAGGDPAHRSARGRDHRPGLRGQVDGRPDRPRDQRRDRVATPPCSTRTSAASPRSTPTRRCSLRPGRPPPSGSGAT